ncbi:tRNA synthetases class I, catalytic domain-containing protein [Dipodascopsis uninucleata]
MFWEITTLIPSNTSILVHSFNYSFCALMKNHCNNIISRLSVKRHYSLSKGLADLSRLNDAAFISSRRKTGKNIHPEKPARTRFAPSPTGFLHLGSLRTALYNYLLAKATNGQFLLRLEDTDQNRLKQNAEQNIYDSLKWTGIEWNEGPLVGGEYGPYRQSERLDIYRKHVSMLLENGSAYRCFCSKERMDTLRESALKLNPPSMATYDRHCFHLDEAEIREKLESGIPYTVRFKSPEQYPKVTDLLHGQLDLQIQVNFTDTRYDDPVLLKTDGFPTYHLANVVDDHLMNITHVIRGEEWLPSTPKHIALYHAFNWEPPSYVHIPLLTSLEDKKLSKRTGDIGITEYAKTGIYPESLVNFVALFGWSPNATQASNVQNSHASQSAGEYMSMNDLIRKFNLNGLTKGNAKVSMSKLSFFNTHYLKLRIDNEDSIKELVKASQGILKSAYPEISEDHNDAFKFETDFVTKLLHMFKGKISTISELPETASYILQPFPDLQSEQSKKFIQNLKTNCELKSAITILSRFLQWCEQQDFRPAVKDIEQYIKKLSKDENLKSSTVYQSLRFAISGYIPGAPLPQIIDLLLWDNVKQRCQRAIEVLRNTSSCI